MLDHLPVSDGYIAVFQSNLLYILRCLPTALCIVNMRSKDLCRAKIYELITKSTFNTFEVGP